jgi:hypothetical protein
MTLKNKWQKLKTLAAILLPLTGVGITATTAILSAGDVAVEIADDMTEAGQKDARD